MRTLLPPRAAPQPDAPAVALEDALHQSQPHPCLEFIRTVSAERRQTACQHIACQSPRRYHPRKNVPHAHSPGCDFDPGVLALAGELKRIGEQIHPHLQQQDGISLAGWQLARVISTWRPSRSGSRVCNAWRTNSAIFTFCLFNAAVETGELEQIVDQVAHLLGVRAHRMDQPRGLCERLGNPPADARKTIDGPQGGAQVVGYRVAERFQLLVGVSSCSVRSITRRSVRRSTAAPHLQPALRSVISRKIRSSGFRRSGMRESRTRREFRRVVVNLIQLVSFPTRATCRYAPGTSVFSRAGKLLRWFYR